MMETIGIPFVWITVSVIFFASGVNCTVCTEKAKHFRLPDIRFCTADNAVGNPVVVDGFYANRLKIETCVCRFNVKNSAQSENTTVTYQNAYNISPIQNISNCSSSVYISRPGVQDQVENCKIDGFMSFRVIESEIQLVLRKERPDGDTSYCFKLYIDSGKELNISCTKTDVTEASTKMTYPVNTYLSTETLESTSIKVTSESTDDTNIPSIPTRQSNTNNSTIGVKNRIQNDDKDNTMFMHIAIGCGSVGGLLLIMVVICLVSKSRRNKRQPRRAYEHNNHNDNDGEYGLQYNALYLSTNDNGIQPNKDEASSSKNGVDMTKIAYQVDGNYSDIDLNDMPLRENCIHKLTDTAIRDGIETPTDGNYSEVGLVEKQTLVNNDNKGFVTSAKFKNDSFSVKHVISPGGDGCEYAVVEKQNGSNDSNVVYSVVDKTNKHNL